MSDPNAQPPAGKGFQKGQSGNPGGRSKAYADFVRTMQEHAPTAIEKLILGLQDKDPKQVKFSVEMILAYAYGKPKQAIEVSGEEGGPIGFELIRRVIVDPRTGNPDT